MKKIVLASLLVSGLMAADSGFYVGVDAGNTDADFKSTNQTIGVSGEVSDDATSYTFKAGYYFNQNNRVNTFYQHINTSGDVAKAEIYGVGYDYLIGTNPFKPFIGVIAGYGNYEESGVEIAGNVYGAQVGLNYSITDAISIEAGYRYIKSNMDETAVSLSTGNIYKFEIDPIKNWFVGANYKF